MQKTHMGVGGRYGWYVSLVGACTTAVSSATASQFSGTLAPLAALLGTTEQAIALGEPVKSVTVVAAMLVAPKLIEKYGMRLSFLLGIVAFLLPQILIPYAASYPVFIALKALQGFSALLFPLVLTLVMEWNDPRNMGLTTSVFMGIFYAGGAFGGTVGGLATGLWGWRSSYHVFSALMLAMGALFLTTVSPRKTAADREAAKDGGAYGAVVRNELAWFLVLAFLPTVWTIQAIWSDMIPFGQSLGYNEPQMGKIMSISAAAILAASLASGKASDFCASRAVHRLKARVWVFSAGAALIVLGVAVLFLLELKPPALSAFNALVFLLSFGAAWGLGSFYCIIPEAFRGDGQVSAANGFIGGIADMAMPVSPVVMAVLGIERGQWNLAWFSCVLVCCVGFFFSLKILKQD